MDVIPFNKVFVKYTGAGINPAGTSSTQNLWVDRLEWTPGYTASPLALLFHYLEGTVSAPPGGAGLTYTALRTRVVYNITTSNPNTVAVVSSELGFTSVFGVGAVIDIVALYDAAFDPEDSQGSVTNLYGYRASPTGGLGSSSVGTYIGFECRAPTGAATTNVCFRGAAPTAGTNRAVLQFRDTGATSAGGITWGDFEFSEYRCAANVKCNTASDRVGGYLGIGAITAPANTAVGAFSTTKATPTLQAFGAVVANAASGTLAFTVSTAASTCATAVVTNTNVVAGSTVILTNQGYTGTLATNGFPTVARLDTSGSSVGSFTLSLCNTHPANALTGNLFVGFWVLN